MFEKLFERLRSKETPDREANELIRQLAHEIAFMTPEEKLKINSGEKLQIPSDLSQRYGEALSLLEGDELSPEIKEALQDIVKSVEEAYLIG
jgi:hypothetical protein